MNFSKNCKEKLRYLPSSRHIYIENLFKLYIFSRCYFSTSRQNLSNLNFLKEKKIRKKRNLDDFPIKNWFYLIDQKEKIHCYIIKTSNFDKCDDFDIFQETVDILNLSQHVLRISYTKRVWCFLDIASILDDCIHLIEQTIELRNILLDFNLITYNQHLSIQNIHVNLKNRQIILRNKLKNTEAICDK